MIARCAVAVVRGVVGTTAGASTRGTAAAKTTTKWAAGDCYSDANVDFDKVTLSSKVACTKTHDVQIINGAPLPATLASAGLAALTSTSSSVRTALVTFAALTCSVATHADALYPKVWRSPSSHCSSRRTIGSLAASS
jgi:hypothetical protein